MSAQRMKPRTPAEQKKYTARQLEIANTLNRRIAEKLDRPTKTVLCFPGDPDLELLTSPAESDTTIDQWSKAFVAKDKFKPLSVGRYVAKMMDLHYGLSPSAARSKWLEKMIHSAIASARADERRQCLAVLNDAVIKVEALPTVAN